MLVRREALAQHLLHGRPPARRRRLQIVRAHEAVDPVASQPVGERVPRGQRLGARWQRWVVGGRDERERRHARGLLEREVQRSVRAHRGAREHGALAPGGVQHGAQVAREIFISVCARRGRWQRAAVPAGVVGDHAVAGALEQA